MQKQHLNSQALTLKTKDQEIAVLMERIDGKNKEINQLKTKEMDKDREILNKDKKIKLLLKDLKSQIKKYEKLELRYSGENVIKRQH